MPFADELLAQTLEQLRDRLQRARALLSRRQFAEASRLLGEAYRPAFGLDRRFLQMMQPSQVAQILGRKEKVLGFAELMAEEAELLRAQGDSESASATARWALVIVQAAQLSGEAAQALLARLQRY